MRTNALAKLGLVVMGFAMAGILLELVLQLGSLFVDAPMDPTTAAWKTDDRRILALGDSHTYGVWIAERERNAYPGQLERIWNEGDHQPIEVLNLGYPGTNSSRLVGLYPELMEAFAPDVVLVMVGVNDFWTQPVTPADRSTGLGLIAFVKRHSRLYKGLYMLGRRAGADAVKITDDPDSSSERGDGTIRMGDHEFAVGWTTEIGDPDKVKADLHDDLRRLIELSRLSSGELVLMTYPAQFRYYGLANPVIRSIAKENDVPLIDLEQVFKPLCPEFRCEAWLYEDQHPNEQGYRIVAETITSTLRELLR